MEIQHCFSRGDTTTLAGNDSQVGLSANAVTKIKGPILSSQPIPRAGKWRLEVSGKMWL